MKAIVIKIRDIGSFRDPRISKSQDKVMDENGKTSRFNKRSKDSTPYIKVPGGKLDVRHVANLLRVLWGERPVPSIRKVNKLFVGDPYFNDLARKARVKITSILLPPDKVHEKCYYPEETTTIRKSIGDSWQTATIPYILDGSPVQVKGGILCADRLRRMLGDDLYKNFNTLVSKYGGATTIKKGIELLNVNKKKPDVVSFCDKCQVNKRISLSNMILNKGANSITIHASPSNPLNLLMASGTVEIIQKFDATLYVPVTNEDLKRIDNAPGIATYLEGGFATIIDIEDWSEIIESQTEATIEGELCI